MARKIKFGTYDSALDGKWTLTNWQLSPAVYKSNFVSVPGRDGDLDLTTVLTDGIPRYGNRTLTATFESSEGTRLAREARISTMVNWLDGLQMNIVLPDDEEHYMTGRVHVAREYNDLAHAAVTVTAILEPWRYRWFETIFSASAVEGYPAETVRLPNAGRRMVVPVVKVEDPYPADAALTLECGALSWTLAAGSYQLPDLAVPTGGLEITYGGVGDLTIAYREADL